MPPSTFCSLPHCHAVLHSRTRTDAVVASAISICLHSFFIPLLYSERATPTSSTWTAWCRPPRRDRRRPPRRGGRSNCNCQRARPPEVARGHPTSPEATRGCSRPSERTTANRGRKRGGIFPRLPDRVLIRLIKLISRFRLIDDDAAGERAAEVVHFPILRGLPPPEFPREKND